MRLVRVLELGDLESRRGDHRHYPSEAIDESRRICVRSDYSDEVAIASLECEPGDDAKGKSEIAALALKLGKPLYRKRTEQYFRFFASVPGCDDVYAPEIPKPSTITVHHKYQLPEIDSVFVRSCWDHVLKEDLSAHSVNIVMTGDSRVSLFRNRYDQLGQLCDNLTGYFFVLLSSDVNSARQDWVDKLEAIWPEGWRARLQHNNRYSSRKPEGFPEIKKQLSSANWTRFSIRGDWSNLNNAICRFLESDTPNDCTNLELGFSDAEPNLLSSIHRRREKFGLPDLTSINSFYTSKKWNPFEPPKTSLNVPVRRFIYESRKGDWVRQLMMVHQPDGKTILEYVVVDKSGKARAQKEILQKLKRCDLPFQIWKHNPWHRYNNELMIANA